MSIMNAELWYSIVNLIPLPWWFLMIFAPRTSLTKRLTQNYLIFFILAVLYVIFLGLGMSQLPTTQAFSFGFDHVRQSLSQSGLLFVGAWIHYLVFDLFVGFWIYKEGLRLNIPAWQIGICLFFTLMTGPFGLGLFLIRRQFNLSRGSALPDVDSSN